MNKILAYLLCLCCISCLTSCYTITYPYIGNVHQSAIGKTKNEVLRSYGVSDRIEDDGAGGSVLVYEKYTLTTFTNSNSSNYGRGVGVYNTNGIIARSNSITTTSGISQTSTSKEYCYLFVNKENLVYDFKSNTGAIYDYNNPNKCFNKRKTWFGVGLSCMFVIFPPVFLVTVPLALVKQKQAKKKGIICDDSYGVFD